MLNIRIFWEKRAVSNSLDSKKRRRMVFTGREKRNPDSNYNKSKNRTWLSSSAEMMPFLAVINESELVRRRQEMRRRRRVYLQMKSKLEPSTRKRRERGTGSFKGNCRGKRQEDGGHKLPGWQLREINLYVSVCPTKSFWPLSDSNIFPTFRTGAEPSTVALSGPCCFLFALLSAWDRKQSNTYTFVSCCLKMIKKRLFFIFAASNHFSKQLPTIWSHLSRQKWIEFFKKGQMKLQMSLKCFTALFSCNKEQEWANRHRAGNILAILIATRHPYSLGRSVLFTESIWVIIFLSCWDSTEAEKRGGRQSLRPGPGPSRPRICTILGKTGSFPPFYSRFSIKKQVPIISRAVLFSPLFSEKQTCHRRQVTGHLWSTIKSQLALTRVYGRWKWAGWGHKNLVLSFLFTRGGERWETDERQTTTNGIINFLCPG